MTTIAAFAQDGIVYMAGDKGGTIYEDVMLTSIAPKVRKHGNVLLGCSGCGIVLDVLSQWDIPQPPSGWFRPETVSFLFTDLIPSMREALIAGEAGRRDKDQSDRWISDGSFILGVNGLVVLLSARLEIAVPTYRYGAIGSGHETALGSLHALGGMHHIKPADRIRLVMGAAAEHDVYTHAEYDTVITDLTEEPAP